MMHISCMANVNVYIFLFKCVCVCVYIFMYYTNVEVGHSNIIHILNPLDVVSDGFSYGVTLLSSNPMLPFTFTDLADNP